MSSEFGEGVKVSCELIHLNRDKSDLRGGVGDFKFKIELGGKISFMRNHLNRDHSVFFVVVGGGGGGGDDGKRELGTGEGSRVFRTRD